MFETQLDEISLLVQKEKVLIFMQKSAETFALTALTQEILAFCGPIRIEQA